jgi:TRAP-type mannitol/chloroaromatic compound transport system substrate-binding protein
MKRYTDRRSMLKRIGAGTAASAAIAAPALAQTAPDVKWRMTTSWPKSLDTLYGGCEFMARRVAELSENRFQLQVFAGGEIVPGLQVLDAVQSGTVECGHTSPYYYFGKDPTFTFGTDLPFGMNVRMRNAWLYHGGGLDLLNQFNKSYNVLFLPGGNTNCQMGGWFRNEIASVNDLKGLKFRIGGFAGSILTKLGVVPQQIAGGDIYPALEKGTIDAAEWVGPYDDEKLGFVKVAKYYYYPGWWEIGPTVGPYVNLQKWESLPKLYQSIFQSAAAETNQWMSAKYDTQNPAALKRLLASGAVLKAFPPDVMLACWKAANELYAEISEKNASFKRVYEQFTAFRSDQYLWNQVADSTMDNYMIRFRTQRG